MTTERALTATRAQGKPGRTGARTLLDHRHADGPGARDDAERVEEPDDDGDHDDGVHERLDRALHRDEPVYQPEEKADDDQREDNV